MSSIELPEFDEAAVEAAAEAEYDAEIQTHESRNLLVLVTHYIVLRVAWIFKTESVIMPVFLDTIAGAGWLRGCLPIINRFGQSVPPVMLADRLRRTRHKKWPLLVSTLLMAIPFLTLSGIWYVLTEKRQPWLPAVFLLLYAAFFVATGLNQLIYGTLQGKLIRPDRRGRLLGIAGIVGSIISVTGAWFLLQRWLALPGGGFEYIFAFAGVGFVISGLVSAGVAEPASRIDPNHPKSNNHFRSAWELFRDDRNFRRLAVVTMLFITAQLLFPHYQALGRSRLDSGSFSLMLWVVVQNAAVGLFSVAAGVVADSSGNRIVIRFQVFVAAVTPLLAIVLSGGMIENGGDFFWLTFFLLGMVPVTFRTLTNYTLEISKEADHPRYLSTLKLCMAVPFLFSPLVGLLIDVIGFEVVFVGVAILISIGGLLTFRMSEPRRWVEG